MYLHLAFLRFLSAAVITELITHLELIFEVETRYSDSQILVVKYLPLSFFSLFVQSV